MALKARRAKQEAQAAKAGTGVASVGGATLSWEEQKKRRSRQNQLPKLRDKAVAGIEVLEARKKELQAIYAEPGFFERHTYADIAKFEAEQTALEKKLEALMAEWEQIESEMSEGGAGA